MNYYQVFMVSARTSQVRQAVTNRSHNNPVSPSSSAAPNEGAIREETKHLTSRKTHKQTQASTIRGSSTNTGGVFKSGHAHKHLSTHLSLSHTHTHTHKSKSILSASLVSYCITSSFLKASSFVYTYNNVSCIFKKGLVQFLLMIIVSDICITQSPSQMLAVYIAAKHIFWVFKGLSVATSRYLEV